MSHSYTQLLQNIANQQEAILFPQTIENLSENKLELENDQQQQQFSEIEEEFATTTANDSISNNNNNNNKNNVSDISTQQNQKKVTKKIVKKEKKPHQQQKIQKKFLRSQKKRLQDFKEKVQCSQRTEKIQEKLLQTKQNMFQAYRVMFQSIVERKLWRKEIVAEIWEMAGGSMQNKLKDMLHEKEEQLRSSLFLMNKQSQNHLPQWNYLLVNQDSKSQFQRDLMQSKVKQLEKYGKVIQNGYGNNPPAQIINSIKKQFLMFEYEPGFNLKKLAMENYENEDYQKAIELFSQYLNMYNKTNKTALINRGLSYMKIGMFSEALVDFQKCTILYPQCHKGFLYAGQLQLQQEQFVNALNNFKQANQLQNKDIDVLIYQAMTYFKLSCFDKSLEACKSALQIIPTNAFALAIIHKINQQKQSKSIQQKYIQNQQQQQISQM